MKPVGMYANPQVTFDTRLYESSGEYEIMVSLNNAQHCDYGIQAMTTVNPRWWAVHANRPHKRQWSRR